jgi:hypothetical protein
VEWTERSGVERSRNPIFWNFRVVYREQTFNVQYRMRTPYCTSRDVLYAYAVLAMPGLTGTLKMRAAFSVPREVNTPRPPHLHAMLVGAMQEHALDMGPYSVSASFSSPCAQKSSVGTGYQRKTTGACKDFIV